MKKYILVLLFFCQNIYSQGDLVNSNMSFLPDSGKYIVSAWVKEIHPKQVATYTSFIKVEVTGVVSPLVINFESNGAVIDGWQRIVGVLEIPSVENAVNAKLNINLHCNNISGGECYFDDVRFYPFNGNLKSFVYDEDTQRLMAELDENNYATFYEYDLEGGLVRVKKETERGVFTIQETRSNNPKKD